MITVEEFEKALDIVQKYQKQILAEYERTKSIAKHTVSRNTNIEDLGLSVNALFALKAAEIRTVGDLLGTTLETLSHRRRVGSKTIEQISEMIKQLIIT